MKELELSESKEIKSVEVKVISKYPIVQATSNSFGFDLSYDGTLKKLECLNTRTLTTGTYLDMPPGVHALVVPRSSLSKSGVLTHTGVIDSDYKGEIKVTVTGLYKGLVQFYPGERCAQLLFINTTGLPLELVGDVKFINKERGTGGFGSTGK